ncbi:2-oxoadipate dioxygenase/decarboxylase HglS [Salinisphaera orenii]|uniref:2-oxoadipate dioxygenase/decarboxylase HglS n=1 Tax=Salinisphaera orenii TaxID=856731 RepID=UPI000DBE7613
MSDTNFVHAADIRARFARAMSAMYQAEVPQYGTLIELVNDVNAEVLAANPALAERLTAAGERDRIGVERHGAIRVGTPDELAMLRRLFAVMGMQPVGYYDLSVAGVPVHSTAFRPLDKAELDTNPFRLFTSLLRLDLIQNMALRERAEAILAARDIFTPNVRTLIDRYERQGGLDTTDADAFVTEALETFRWHADATVDYATYDALRHEHPLIADVVCFRGPHINHLTPRTLDIDAVQARMPDRGITPKAVIEGPPRRDQPILLRQTSFKALEETIRFAGDTAGQHTARFGEIEQRGAALTPRGRALYDRLLNASKDYKQGADNTEYQAQLAAVFEDFPDDLETLRRDELAYFQYRATGQPAPNDSANDLETLVAAGCITADPIIYEDFLPVSAAGIFRSNLGDDSEADSSGDAQRDAMESALGTEITDEMALYADIQARSIERALTDVPTAATPG